jgi:N-acetyltransferase
MEVNEDLRLSDKPPFDPKPVTLDGIRVRLEPLESRHLSDLKKAGWNENLFRYLPTKPLREMEDYERWLAETHREVQAGRHIAFAIWHKEDECAVGSTRFLEINHENRAIEIGWTWVGSDYQRTPVNTECKWLLLKHAFEDLGAVRVQLKTDARNLQSQTAIARIGAKKEGILRNHKILPDGFVRDSVMYSVTDKDWFREVKSQLRLRLL